MVPKCSPRDRPALGLSQCRRRGQGAVLDLRGSQLPYPTSRPPLQVWWQGPARTELAGEGERLAWRVEAACKYLPTELFFPIGHGPRAQAQTTVAKAVCNACSVKAQCLDYALAANAQYGVFGGLSEEERREARRRLGHRYGLAEGGLEASA
jgi:WhiB family transcriptional regulator, redox-sensing transcriptional regulator